MARTAASESRAASPGRPGVAISAPGKPSFTSTPRTSNRSLARKIQSAGPKFRASKSFARRTGSGSRKRRQSEESVLLGADKKAKTMAAKEDHDLFTKMTTYMDGKFAASDAKVDDISNKVGVLSASVTNLTGQVNKNVAEIVSLQAQINTIKAAPPDGVRKQVKKILEELGPDGNKRDLERLSSEVERLKSERSGTPPVVGGPVGDSGIPATERNYWTARKAVRIWPVPGDNNRELWTATGDFFYSILKIPREHLEEDMVERIRRVAPQSRGKKHRRVAHDEVVVYLRDVNTRDMIQSYAPNLSGMSGKAGLRLEVPCHLTGQFKCLERYGHILKKKFGHEFRWHINYDDIDLSLKLSVRGPGDEAWERIDWETAKKEVKLAEKPTDFRSRLTSSTSNASTGDSNGEEVIEIDTPVNSYTLPRSQTLEKYKEKQGKAWGSGQS